MVQTISSDRSALAIQVSAGLSNVANIICVIVFLMLVNHFNSQKSDKINSRIKTFAIVPIITSIALNTWFGMFGNNSIWSFLNDLFPFISMHCARSMRMILVLAHIDMYAVSMFILLQTQNFFADIRSIALDNRIYTYLTYLLSTITVIYVMASFVAPEDAFEVTIYNSNEYKQCELTFVSGHESLVIFPWLVISQNILQFALLCICTKQLFDFRQYTQHSKELSQHFSGRQKDEHIHRFLVLSIFFIISYWLCFVVLAFFQWTLFAVPIVIKVSAIFLSFDLYRRKKIAQRRKVSPQKQIVSMDTTIQFVTSATSGNTSASGMRLTSRTRRNFNRYAQTRDYSYSHSLSRSRSVSNASSHSEILKIFEEEYREEICGKYDVGVEYLEECKSIQAVLIQLFIPSIYARIIAEYAATQYLHCIYCRNLFGFIECRKDYMVDCGTTAVGDENDSVRYYLDLEPEDLSQCEEENAFQKEIEILCVECAKDKICGVCNDCIILSHTEIVDECLNCKVAVCEMCSYSCQYENGDGIEFTLCPKCNENVGQEVLNGFIRDQTASLSHRDIKQENENDGQGQGQRGEEEHSKSTSNDWRKWDFGTFNFL